MTTQVTLQVDGSERTVDIDVRTTLLDALRDRLGETSPKKGCDHGQCGACTVLLDGRRHLTCLSLAVDHDGAEITTAAGLVEGERLHEVQEAFVDRDALQCGYCTPGQVCSVVGMLAEAAQGQPSYVSADLASPPPLDAGEVRERLSGNLCRCGAYVNICAAALDVAGGRSGRSSAAADTEEVAG